MPANHKGPKPDTRPSRVRCRGQNGRQVRGRYVGDCKCGGRLLHNGKDSRGVWTWCPRCGSSAVIPAI